MLQERKFSSTLVFLLLGIVLVAVGIFLLKGVIFDSGGVEIVDDTEVLASKSAVIQNTGELIVEVSGAVNKPGVYHFQLGARIDDALNAANGISKTANTNFVSQSINRAAKLVDGQKIYIPIENENVVLGDATKATNSNNGLININTASQSELEALPGVGPATASKIINGRPYSSLDELTSKKTMSSKVFEEVKEKISLY